MKTKNFYRKTICTVALICSIAVAQAQNLHFSQYYNAPQLLNPANTALMPDYDYRIGAIYRNQWATIPVPYNTTSGFADFKLAKAGEGINNWLGIGGAFFSDKAGDGNLSLTQFQLSAAYHLSFNERNMISFGLAGSYVQRSVNYDELTFDAQWDGFTFNKSNANNEQAGIAKTHYQAIGAGINYAYTPGEAAYIKIGFAIADINQPKETFYNSSNQVGMRPIGNIDALFRLNDAWIINPSAYYSTQSGASELVAGALFRTRLGQSDDNLNTQFIFGGYYRLNEAVIGNIGLQWGRLQALLSYDATISSLNAYNSGYGAFEFSLIYMGLYGVNGHSLASYNCPRFF